MATLYLCRGSLLQHVADRRIDRLEQRYKLDIAYDKLTMKGLSTVSLHGFTVVPEHRDTLLRLHSLEVRISLWKLLWGNIKVRNVQMDGLKLDFIKQDSTANYDFLSCLPIQPRLQKGHSPQARNTCQRTMPGTPIQYSTCCSACCPVTET